jgi:hypothetical protein
LTTSELLYASWRAWQNATLYKTWAKANPGEDDKLRAFWNHGDDAGVTAPTLATATGKALVLEAQAYWQAVADENAAARIPVGPLPGYTAQRVTVAPDVHPKVDGWVAADLSASPGTPVYAVETGKIPHVTPGSGSFNYDALSGVRYGYRGVEAVPNVSRKPERGEQIATVIGNVLTLACSSPAALDRVLYTTEGPL